MTTQLGDIVRHLQAAAARQTTILVGVDGLGGAGKTVLAAAVAGNLRSAGQPVALVHFDDFFLPSSERPSGPPESKPIGGDFDWCRLRDEVLVSLRANQAARYRKYDWTLDALAETHEIPPVGTVIVEGVYCTRKELTDLYDVRVWVECPRDLRLARGIRRDGEAARDRWELDWMPSEDLYVGEHRPIRAAHFVISGLAV